VSHHHNADGCWTTWNQHDLTRLLHDQSDLIPSNPLPPQPAAFPAGNLSPPTLLTALFGHAPTHALKNRSSATRSINCTQTMPIAPPRPCSTHSSDVVGLYSSAVMARGLSVQNLVSRKPADAVKGRNVYVGRGQMVSSWRR